MDENRCRNFLYVPSFGFYEIDGFEQGERGNKKWKADMERTESDRKVMEILQKRYPGCRIVQNGNRWDIIPDKQKYNDYRRHNPKISKNNRLPS